MARSVDDVALLLSVMAGPDRARSVVAAGAWRGVSRCARTRFRRRANRVERATSDATRSSPRSPRLQRGAFGVRRPRLRASPTPSPISSGVDELFQTLRAAGYAAAYGRDLERQRALAQGHRRLEHRAGAQADAGGSRARREPRSACSMRASRSSSRDYDFLVLPTVQVLPFPVEVGMGAARSTASRCTRTSIGWRTCYAISCLGCPAISPCLRFHAGWLAGRVADRRAARARSRRAARSRGVRAGDALCSASPIARLGSVGRSCAPTIRKRKPSATIFTSVSNASRKYISRQQVAAARGRRTSLSRPGAFVQATRR